MSLEFHPRTRSASAQAATYDAQIRFDRSAEKFVSLAPSRNFRTMEIRDLSHWLASNGILEKPSLLPKRSDGRLAKQYEDERVFKETDRMIRAIDRGEVDPVESASRTVDYMVSLGLSNNTIRRARYTICKFLNYSKLGLDPYDLSRSVKNLPRVWANLKRTPSREEVRSILLASDLRMKSVFSTLISTGGRVGEILAIRKDQIDWNTTPVQVHLRANKVYRNRIAFLSSETVMLLKDYLKTRKDDFQHIFSGYLPRTSTQTDRPLSVGATYDYFKRIRNKLRLTQKYDTSHYYYRPKVFRVLNLEILKTNGYPPDWAEFLVGHSVSSQGSYLPSISTLAAAWLKHDRHFCFLAPNTPELPTEKIALTASRTLLPADGASTVKVEQRHDYVLRTTRWRTRNFDYVKTHIQSTGYDQAIADGFSIFDSSPNGVRVFRKRFRGGKQWLKSFNRVLVPKHTAFKDDGKPL